MRERIGKWLESKCEHEPAWVEPLEWMLIGSCITLLLMGFVMGVI